MTFIKGLDTLQLIFSDTPQHYIVTRLLSRLNRDLQLDDVLSTGRGKRIYSYQFYLPPHTRKLTQYTDSLTPVESLFISSRQSVIYQPDTVSNNPYTTQIDTVYTIPQPEHTHTLRTRIYHIYIFRLIW